MSTIEGTLIGRIYQIQHKIGRGAFGVVFAGINTNDNTEVAIKCEKDPIKDPQIQNEYQAYHDLKGEQGIAEVFHYTRERNLNILVMERLGPSLEDYFKLCDKKFSLKTVLMITEQLLKRLEHFHSRGYIHRDLKPGNLAFGSKKMFNLLYIIDLGLTKKFIDPNTNQHIPFKDTRLYGTARYSSINAGRGYVQSRRDDLESVGYIILCFLKGSLPWDSIKVQNKKEKFIRITRMKEEISVERLCDGCPKEFLNYLKYCRNLGFSENPDYKYLRKIFSELFYRQNFSYDFNFDWTSIGSKG